MMKSDQKPIKPPKDKNQHIQVFVRVRPPTPLDKQKYLWPVVECPSNKEVIVKDKPTSLTTKTFTFDRVFGQQSKQVDIYHHVVNPLIEEVLAGYNCTVFAYGQTGTGKTFTMEGERSMDPNINWENDPLCGIIPRTLSHLFDELRQQQVEFTVRVSFLELYNEELIDLLSPADDGIKIRIFEDVSKKGSVIIQGLEEITVHNKDDVYHILTKGSEKRQTAATLMNAHSSRSHTVFSITIHIKENLVGGDELLKTGKLNLVDLAGSENIGRSGAVEKRAREAGNINQSLLTLGRVITALVERAPHVPYRESKLTRLLQDSLGGRTKTCFIATISPISSNLEETLSTLDYAHRAKNITNRPEINQKLTKKELLKEYTEEIERLRRDLLATREKNGVFLDPGEFQRMSLKMNELEQENAGKLAHIKALREEMEKMERLCNDLHIQVEEKSSELTHKTEMLVQTEDRLQRTQTKLVKTVREKEINEHLVNHHEEKEKQLGEQAMTLVKVADQSTTDVSRLHDKLARKRSVEEGNKSRSEQFKENFHRNFGRMDDWLEKLLIDHNLFCAHLRSALGDQQDKKISELTIMSEHLTKQVQLFTELLHGMERKSAEAMRQAHYWVQHHLEVVRTTTGTSAEALRSSLTDLILPPLQGIMQHLREYQSNLQELSSQVNDMIREREHQSEVYSVETMDAITSLEESVTQYSLQQKQEIEWLRTSSQNYLEDTQTETKEMQTQMQAMREMLDRMFALTESKQQRANLTATELGEGLNRCENSCEKFSSEMKKVSESLKKKQTKHTASQKQYSENLLNVFSDFVEKSTVGIGNTQHLREEAVSSCWTAVNSNEDAWRELYHATEEDLREHSEQLSRYLQSELEQTQTLTNKVRESAEVQESLLESQRNSFRSFVQKRQEELEEECSAVRERGQVLSDELRKREFEMNHFFSSELIEDRPTGETPPRRDYIYPRRLVASSPRERVIQRVLAQMDSAARLLPVIPNSEKEKEEFSEKLSTSTRSLPEMIAHKESQPSSETSSLQKASSESNVSVSVDDSTKENQIENQENLGPMDHKKNASQIVETQRRRLKYRKPLISKNSE